METAGAIAGIVAETIKVDHAVAIDAVGDLLSGTVADESRLQAVSAVLGTSDAAALAARLQERGDGPAGFAGRAPAKRRALWERTGLVPRGRDMTAAPIDEFSGDNFVAALATGLRCALANGWGNAMAMTVARDITDGSPQPEVDTAGTPVVKGFSAENIYTILGGTYRSTYVPLLNAIVEGRIRGAVAIVGSEAVSAARPDAYLALARELISQGVLVTATGAAAAILGEAGLMVPEAACDASDGLREVCEAVGLPAVLHFGSTAETCRIFAVLCNLIADGGLDADISDLPVAAAAPEVRSGDILTLGLCVVGSGVTTWVGMLDPMPEGPGVVDFITSGIEPVCAAKFAVEPDPVKTAAQLVEHMNAKRKMLGITEIK